MMSALDGHTLPSEQHYFHLQGRGYDGSSRGHHHDQRHQDGSPRRHQSSHEASLRGRRSPSNEGTRRGASESPRRRMPVEEHMTRSMGMDELHYTPSGRKKSPGRGIYNGAFKELQNLKETTSRRQSKSPHGHQSYRSEVNKKNYGRIDQPENFSFIPKMLRLQAERDEPEFKLPPIPVPAWEERPQQMPPQIGKDFGMPLLSVNAAYTESNLFPGYHRLPQGPPPPPFGLHSQPPPDDRPLPPMYQNMLQRIDKRVSDGPPKIDMPLLSLPKNKDLLGPSDAAFGRLLDPNLIISHEQQIKQKELLRHKNNLDFLRSQVKYDYIYIC